MRTTRIVFAVIVLANIVLNGLALIKQTANLAFVPDILLQTLSFNLLFVPIVLYAAYRLGQIAEEQYQAEERSRGMNDPAGSAQPADRDDEVRLSEGAGSARSDHGSSYSSGSGSDSAGG